VKKRGAMRNDRGVRSDAKNRRTFLKNGAVTVGAAAMGAGVLGNGLPAFAWGQSGNLSPGDAAILRFLAAAETLETDAWQQYNELAGVQDKEIPGGSGNMEYTAALSVLDADMSQYLHDQTEDSMTHFQFIDAYLTSKGAERVNLDQFRTLPSSTADGAQQIGRLTNLMQLSVDTSWWTRYRSRDNNPDLDPDFIFPQAIPTLSKGKHPGIPRNNGDLTPKDHLQAIANTAGFHFAFIEQGGTSVYPSLAQKVSNREVLRILLSIGPTEMAHFQTWHDKAGNAPPLTDPSDPTLVFPDLNKSPFGGEDFQTNLIMPEPCPFLSRKLPVCSIIRPNRAQGAAMRAAKALVANGLFIGQSPQFFQAVLDLASDADQANRECD
jgi:Ferritin-like domain